MGRSNKPKTFPTGGRKFARWVVTMIACFGGVRMLGLMETDHSLQSSLVYKDSAERSEPTPAVGTKTTGDSRGSFPPNQKTKAPSTPEPTHKPGIQGTKETTHNSTEATAYTEDPFVLDAGCPRFATMDHGAFAGLGHKLAEVVLGMDFARETNATYVYDERIWARRGKHGAYRWLPEFLPLQETEFTTDRLDRWKQQNRENREGAVLNTLEGPWVDLVKRSRQPLCRVAFHTTVRQCCEEGDTTTTTCYCTKATSRIGAFERTKNRLRSAWGRSRYTPPRELAAMGPPSAVSVVWHVRLGDIVLNARKEYFRRLARQVADAFSTSSPNPPHVFVVGEGGREPILRSFPFLPEVCDEFFNRSCSYPVMDARETFYHMIRSDVLVTSGSSFSAVAAMLRTSGITLAAMPKEGLVGIYGVSENLEVEEDGTIPRIEMLETFLESTVVGAANRPRDGSHDR